jgi:serine/threonine protein kinase
MFWGLCEPSPHDLWFIMEHCDQSLRRYLDTKGSPMAPEEKLRLIMEIAAALKILHQQQILHRDLKASNVLLTDKLQVKLADFGFSRAFDDATMGMSLVGTPGWMAPELFSDTGYSLSPAVDIFAFAMTIFEILDPAYVCRFSTDSWKTEITKRKPKWRPALPPDSLSQAIAPLLKECWHANPLRRPSAQFIDTFCQQLQKSLPQAGPSSSSAGPALPSG